MADFDNELFDWLADREGVRVAMMVGVKDPDAPDGDVNTWPLRMHVTLGPVEDATNEDYDRKAVMVSLDGDKWNRIYLDQEWITDATVKPHGVRVTFHDAFSIWLSGD